VTYLLDTGVWYRAAAEPQSIPPAEAQILADRSAQFGLSTISLWEIGKKVQIGKLRLTKDLSAWFADTTGEHIVLLPIEPRVVVDAMRLPSFPNRDPADELIVATARVYDLTLLTMDRALKGYRHARIHYFKPLSVSRD
jgi:PIN domain nuclease of toxin-antitoxin system